MRMLSVVISTILELKSLKISCNMYNIYNVLCVISINCTQYLETVPNNSAQYM